MEQVHSQRISTRAKSNKKDFRYWLQETLEQRCSRNPNYSLRSFAKVLGVSPSALSAILTGKRPLTQKMKERLGLKLGLSLPELIAFKAKPHGNQKISLSRSDSESFQQITVDTFSIISEPHHYALLELIKTSDFRWDPKWIAARLSKTVSEINIAMERLERTGLLARDATGKLFDTTIGFSTDIREGLTTQAQKRFQVKSLEQSIAAMDAVDPQLRDNTSMTMAIQDADLPEAKQMIKDFRRKFCSHLEANDPLNEVYQLTISFIPLTKEVANEV